MNQDWLTEFKTIQDNSVPSNVEDTLSALYRVKTSEKINEEDYLFLKNQLTKTTYDREMSMAIYIYLNQSLKRKPHGEHINAERFELMQEAMDRGLVLDKGTISAPRFWNCVNLACNMGCLLYTSPSPRDLSTSRMPSSA